MDKILALFPEDRRQQIIGGTPSLAVGWGNTQIPKRHREILAWLDGNEFGDIPWIALDDDREYFDGACDELYLVDERTGLTQDDVDALSNRIRILRALARPASPGNDVTALG